MKPVDENLDHRARMIASAIHAERGFAALANSVLAEQANSDVYYAALAALEHGDIARPGYFQARVRDWMMACFPAIVCTDLIERGDRLLEEVLELLQSGKYPRERIRALEAYVYGRPAGVQVQEVGGVMVTLAAYCAAFNLDMHLAGESELARISVPVIMEKIRAKQATKPTGSALPMAWTDPQAETIKQVVEALKRARKGYLILMENARNRIVGLGGKCDALDVMADGDPFLKEMDRVLSDERGAGLQGTES